MLESLIQAALKQRLVLVVVAVCLVAFGLDATRKLSVDAFPDVTNVQVQIATEALGRSPEEVERFVTVPLEMAMTGLPGLEEMRSLNKPGLSLITLVFTDATNVYFARQLVMERLIEVGGRMPQNVTPVLGPLSTGLGEVYQYTLEHPDDGDQSRRADQTPHYSGLGGEATATWHSWRGGDQFPRWLRQAVSSVGESGSHEALQGDPAGNIPSPRPQQRQFWRRRIAPLR